MRLRRDIGDRSTYDSVRGLSIHISSTDVLHRFCTNKEFQQHLSRHRHALSLDEDEDEMRQCPVPSCGIHSFRTYDLLSHLVVFHRIPICGSTNHTLLRSIRLPVVTETQPLIPMDSNFDLTHIHDNDTVPASMSAATTPPSNLPADDRMDIDTDADTDAVPPETTGPSVRKKKSKVGSFLHYRFFISDLN
jgi:hypothetical protein